MSWANWLAELGQASVGQIQEQLERFSGSLSDHCRTAIGQREERQIELEARKPVFCF
jgi:hypothetical protein